ncbi:MAG: exonuclease domain-containing protein [Planctomycetota bacterium]
MQRAPRIPRTVAEHGGPIVGVDVETACSAHGAVCALGVVVVHRGRVLRESHWLLDPGTDFDRRFIAIHGIRPEDVRGRPRLRAAWNEVRAFIDDAVGATEEPMLIAGAAPGVTPLFVAHNAQFDKRQIEAAVGEGLPFRLSCTVAMSRRAFPALERHNLATVAAHLRIALKHHDALSDARACALIAHHAIRAGSGA